MNGRSGVSSEIDLRILRSLKRENDTFLHRTDGFYREYILRKVNYCCISRDDVMMYGELGWCFWEASHRLLPTHFAVVINYSKRNTNMFFWKSMGWFLMYFHVFPIGNSLVPIESGDEFLRFSGVKYTAEDQIRSGREKPPVDWVWWDKTCSWSFLKNQHFFSLENKLRKYIIVVSSKFCFFS